MKAKLLIKLRRKYYKKFYILRTGGTWKVYKEGRIDYGYLSLEEAKDVIKKGINKYIFEYVAKKRIHHPKRLGVKYYPW